ncbi:hypothetical protein [Vibrio furnissii]|uniref:hypothetical protein n=1 Tax=Vibrio furnissii TaxID=29494 RepID=UPI003AA8B8B1
MSSPKTKNYVLPESVKLFPLPYFSIAQAAEQIGVSESYIKDAIKHGLVRPCVILGCESRPESASSGVVGCKSIIPKVEVKMPSTLEDNLVGYNPMERLTTSCLDSLISTEHSQFVVTGFEMQDEDFGEVEGDLYGCWQLSSAEDAEKLLSADADDDPVVEVYPYTDECWYQELEVQKGTARVTGFIVNARAENLVLSHYDTKRLLTAYRSVNPIQSIGLGGAKPAKPQKAGRSPSDQMIAMLAALVASHPELGPECLKKGENLGLTLETFLAGKGVDLNGYQADVSTVRRWVGRVSRMNLKFGSCDTVNNSV